MLLSLISVVNSMGVFKLKLCIPGRVLILLILSFLVIIFSYRYEHDAHADDATSEYFY